MEEDEKSLPVFGFGIGGPPRPGERTPQQQIDDAQRRYALATALRNFRRRGAPVKNWRKNLREPMLSVMAKWPDASDAEIARKLWEIKLRKNKNIGVRTIQNWLSVIRRGGVGYGCKRL
ncbi:MAG: hypothetical protein WA624_19465 [Methylocella sp.]